MNTREIPNIEVKKTKYKSGTYYLGGASANLSCWIGYFLNENPREVITNEQFYIGIDNCTEDNSGFSLSQEQVNAYYYLVENQESVKNSIAQALKEKFPSLLEDEYSSYDMIDFPKLSDLTPEFDFKKYIGPSSINITKDVKDNLAYITWHFNCLWDPEHGFEVITHKDRVLEIAQQADGFKIYEDNGKEEEVNRSFDNYLNKIKENKKWWKFW